MTRLKLLLSALLAFEAASLTFAGLVCENRLVAVCNESCYCQGVTEDVEAIEGNTTASLPEDNYGLAFALVTAAGLSTALGASLVFCETKVKQDHFLVLGAALGFSGGVMIYVSFVEIFVKSQQAFESCNELKENPCLWEDEDGSAAYVMATVCLFSGVILTLLIDACVVCLSRHGGSHGHSHDTHSHTDVSPPSFEGLEESNNPTVLPTDGIDAIEDETVAQSTAGVAVEKPESSGSHDVSSPKKKEEDDPEATKKKKLEHMGLMTALAIGLHNFPEGLATFVATVDDPAVGVALAVAIAVHNIPEGLCVAIPLYYSTGSRWKGFCFALLSGITEIIGALFGYWFLRLVFGDVAYGVLFGIVSGMMITIVVKELLPTAHRYDVHDKYVTTSFFAGAAVMSLSLVLFVI